MLVRPRRAMQRLFRAARALSCCPAARRASRGALFVLSLSSHHVRGEIKKVAKSKKIEIKKSKSQKVPSGHSSTEVGCALMVAAAGPRATAQARRGRVGVPAPARSGHRSLRALAALSVLSSCLVCPMTCGVPCACHRAAPCRAVPRRAAPRRRAARARANRRSKLGCAPVSSVVVDDLRPRAATARRSSG